MKLPINVITKEGLKHWESVSSQAEFSKKNNLTGWFMEFLSIETIKKEKQLVDWINSHEMETLEEMEYWRKESDIISINNYFIRRVL